MTSERPALNDTATIEADSNLVFDIVTGLGFYGVNFNMGMAIARSRRSSQDKRLREVLNPTIDRNVLNDVLGMGTYPHLCSRFSTASWAYNPEFDGGERDIERAKALMAEAGHESVSFEILYANNSAMQSLFELVQAMASEAGFKTLCAQPSSPPMSTSAKPAPSKSASSAPPAASIPMAISIATSPAAGPAMLATTAMTS